MGSGSSKVDLGGHAATKLAVSSDVSKLAATMKDAGRNVEFHAAAYKMAPIDAADLKDSLNCFAPRGYIVYDVMFRAIGASWATGWQPQYETNHCAAIDPSKATFRLHHYAAYESAFASHASTLVKSLLAGESSSSTVYSCHWDNNDDTDVDALVVVSYATGEIRTVVGFAGG